MTAVQMLNKSSVSLPAQLIAIRLNKPVVEVYVELVEAEGRGEVRVVIDCRNDRRVCEWEAMQ